MPGRADLEDERLVAPADADLLAMDRERLPDVLVAGRRALVVQALEVEVLHVARRRWWRPTRGGRSCRARCRERTAPRRRAPRSRARAGGARSTRPAAGRAGAGRSRAAACPLRSATRRSPTRSSPGRVAAAGARRSSSPARRPAAGAAGRPASGGRRRPAASSPSSRGECGAQELHVPVARERPSENIAQQAAHEASSSGRSGARRAARTRPGGAGIASIHARTPRGSARSSPERSSSQPAAIAAPARLMPIVRAKRSSSSVQLAEELGEASVRLPQREVHLEQALAGGDEALREPQVVERRRAEM